jgi:hypothetical protein
MIRRCLVLFIASGVVLGCAVNRPTVLPTPLRAEDIQVLENASKGRSGTVASNGEVVAAGVSFAFSETEVFLENERQVREAFPLSPSTSLAFRSTSRGAKLGFARGFWALAGISGVLFVMTGGGEGDGEWLLPFMGASGVVGGAIGSLFGAANGGMIRFEFSSAGGSIAEETGIAVRWKTECCR